MTWRKVVDDQIRIAFVLYVVAVIAIALMQVYECVFPPKPHVVHLAPLHFKPPMMFESDSAARAYSCDTTGTFPLSAPDPDAGGSR